MPDIQNVLPLFSFSSLEEAALKASNCEACELSKTRTRVAFARGNPEARLMIIGEAPGQIEDENGLPFVGQAGLLLDKILRAGNIDPEKDVYICNVVKCRPPGNRAIQAKEREACHQFLGAQLFFVKPKLILLAGSAAVQTIMQVKDPISHIRGKWFPYGNDARVMPVFHPSYLLRNESKEVGSPKWLMWQDIKEVRKQLDLLIH